MREAAKKVLGLCPKLQTPPNRPMGSGLSHFELLTALILAQSAKKDMLLAASLKTRRAMLRLRGGGGQRQVLQECVLSCKALL